MHYKKKTKKGSDIEQLREELVRKVIKIKSRLKNGNQNQHVKMKFILFNYKKYIIFRISLLVSLSFTIQPLVFSFTTQSASAQDIERKTKKDSTNVIMQKAIVKAKDCKNFSDYQTETYYKAILNIHKISRLFNNLLTEKDELPLKNGDRLVQEIITKKDFTTDSFVQTILSSASSFPATIEDFDLERLALYDIYDDSCNFISPLSPIALNVYRYRLENTFDDFYGEKIFRIQVIPKHKNQYAFWGYIDIADSTWQVHHFNLSARINYGVASFSFTIEKHFGEIEHGIRMPETCHVFGEMKTAGFKANIQLFASFTNYYNKRKDSIFVISKKSEKLQQKLEYLHQKKEWNNLDVLKIASLKEKKINKDAKSNAWQKNSYLEVKNHFFIDNLA